MHDTPGNPMCSFFCQVDEQSGDSDIPATFPRFHIQTAEPFFFLQEDLEESDEISSQDNESQLQLNRFLQL